MYRLVIAFAGLLLFTAGLARAENWPPPAPDLAITVLPELTQCLEGEDCRYLVRIANEGSAAFEGKVKLLHLATAPGVPAGPAPCSKRDFNSFTCETALALAPTATAHFLVTIRMLATPLAKAEHCVGILAKDTDPVPANDRHCAMIGIGETGAMPECPAGYGLVEGQCRQLAKLCTDGRGWNEVSQSCTCPADRPVFDRAARGCAVSLAAVQCSGGREQFDGGCYCPQDKPIWDSAASHCRSVTPPMPVIAAGVISTPKPAIEQKPRFERTQAANAKKTVASKRMRHRAKPGVRRKVVRVAAASPAKCPAFVAEDAARLLLSNFLDRSV